MKKGEKLREIKDWKNYDPSKISDSKVLADDFRILAAKFSLEEQGKKTEYEGIENVLKTGEKLLKRILELNEITFHPDLMKPSSKRFLRQTLRRIINTGIELPAPQGELIFNGKKTATVTAEENKNLEKMNFLISGDYVWGFIRFQEPEKITKEDFESYYNEHRITESELRCSMRQKIFDDLENFYLYRIREFIPFEKPKPIPGSLKIVQDKRLFASTFLPKDWNLQKLTDQQLIQLHAQIHAQARKYSLETGKQPPEWMIDQHILIMEEMRRRGLEHRPQTELDELSLEFFKKKEIKENAIFLKDLLNLWQDGFEVRKPLLCFVGGSCVSGWGNDIDINVNWPSWDKKFLDILEFRLKSMIPPEWRDKIHLIPDYRGPFTNYVPFANLKVEMIKPEQRKLFKMSESWDIFREQRIKDAEVKKMAEQSRKEDKVELFRFFIQLKGIAGYRKLEMFTIEGTIAKIKEIWLEDGKFPEIEVDRKFDGFRVQWHHSKDGKNIIWSEDGGDVTKRFPNFLKEANKIKHDFIIDCELEGWTPEGEHMGRSDVSGYAHEKGEPDDSPYFVNAFDCLYYDGQDLHKLPLKERRKFLEKIPSGDKIRVIEIRIVNNEKDLEKAIKYFSKQKGSEGAMLKKNNSIYPLTGHTNEWMKFKKEADIDAEVVEVHRVKGTDSYNYLCAIRDAKGKLVPIGRTYNVKFERKGKPIQVPIGGIIRVAFTNLNKYIDPDTGEIWFNWWAPRPIEYREDKERPDTVEFAEERVKETHGEVEEKKFPKRYRIAFEKLKETFQPLLDYQDWLQESYPFLYDLDPYEYSLLESIGEDELQEQRLQAIKEAEELGLYWDDYFTEDEVLEFENQVEEKLKEEVRLKEQFDIPVADKTDKTLFEHHWRKLSSVHNDHRFKVNDHLNGWTIADQPETGIVDKARKELGIEKDVDTEEEAKKLEKYFYEKKLWKFDPRLPERKVLCFPKARQPLVWLEFKGKVEPGTVGATEHGAGYFYHIQEGTLKEFGTQKVYFKEYWEHGKRYYGRWVVRKIPARKEWEKVGKGKLVWMAWFAKEDFENQIPYILTRRARLKKDYIPPDGLSGLNEEWKKRIPQELRWWEKKKLSDKEKLNLIDKAFNWLTENLKEFPYKKIELKEAKTEKIKWTLSKAWWKGQTVIRGMPVQRFELFLDFGENKLKKFETESNPIYSDEMVGILSIENTKPPKGDFKDWLTFEGELPAEHVKNPNKRIPMYYLILDSGEAKVIEKTDNFIHIDFKGKRLKGRRVFVRESPESDIWVFKISKSVGEER